MSPREGEIQKVDPEARRRSVRWALVVVAAGAGLLAVTPPILSRLETWVLADPAAVPTRVRLILLGFSAVLGGPLLAFALWVWRLGGRVTESGRFPPPGMPVMKDTPVLQGDAARRRGGLLRTLASVLVVAVATLVCLFWLVGGLMVTR